MSHINVKMPGTNPASRKTFHLDSFTGGVSFCNFPTQLYDGQSPYMKNMIYSKNLLRTRFGQKEIETDAILSGKLHSKSEFIFFGNYIFHIGTKLVAFNGESVRILSEELPDCESFIFEMNASLYVFLRIGKVFTLDRDFNCTECELPVFHAYEVTYNLDKIVSYTPDNDYIYLGGISVLFTYEYGGLPYLQLPVKCDITKPVKIIYGRSTQVLLSPDDYTVYENKIELKETAMSDCRVYYYPALHEKFDDLHKIFGSTTTVCYGGKASSGGTRVFFSGNPDYPGYYFYSDLLSPLKIKKGSFDIVGNGVQNINRFAKQKGDLIAFCDSSIYRFVYSFDTNDGADFTVSEINPRIGCDMPESVQLIDNRLVFANSLGGVYIIISSDFTDELSVRSISANINGTGQGQGLLFENRDKLKNCISIDFDRKYYLFIGGNAYVWDYGNAPYIASTDPKKSERLLAWYYFDGLYENSLFEIDGKLYGTCMKEEMIILALLSEDVFTDFGKDIVCEYVSENFDLSFADAKKVLYEMYFGVLDSQDAEITVSVFGDDKEIRREKFVLSGNNSLSREGLARILFRVPGYEAIRFSFKLQSNKGILGLYDAYMKFKADKIYYR